MQRIRRVLSTRDGGQTWLAGAGATGMNDPKERGGLTIMGYPAGIAFASNGFGLMWESRGTLYVTRDGGTNWKAHSRFAQFDVDFGLGGSAFDNGTGFALYQHDGVSERLIETRDFGRTWHVVRRWRY